MRLNDSSVEVGQSWVEADRLQGCDLAMIEDMLSDKIRDYAPASALEQEKENLTKQLNEKIQQKDELEKSLNAKIAEAKTEAGDYKAKLNNACTRLSLSAVSPLKLTADDLVARRGVG